MYIYKALQMITYWEKQQYYIVSKEICAFDIYKRFVYKIKLNNVTT